MYFHSFFFGFKLIIETCSVMVRGFFFFFGGGGGVGGINNVFLEAFL